MKTERFLSLLILCAGLLCPAACGKRDEPDPVPPDAGQTEPDKPEKPEKPDEPDPAALPEGLSVSELSYTHEDGRKTAYFLAVADFVKNPKLVFTVTLNRPKRTPSWIYGHFDKDYGLPCLVTNGGYFAGSTSVSMVTINGFCHVVAPLSMNWPDDTDFKRTIYPVRAALGRMPDGGFDIRWVYCCDPAARTHYSFPSPLGNDEKTETFLKTPPDKDTPGAQVWKPVWGIGGGPMLVWEGKDVAMDSYWRECLNSGGTAGSSRVPRTGAGLDKEGRLLLAVCDGRGAQGSPGLTLTEFAEVFLRHGAVTAMNFDGGGSSAMIGAEGRLLNHPNDDGVTGPVERKVVTCIAISLKAE